MLAVDTNVVVRYLTGDDARQAARARSLVDSQPIWIATTVLLECEWVLRAAYGLPRAEVCTLLRNFCGLPTVTVEDQRLADLALDLCERGLDLADALHLSAAAECEAFVTFDAALVKIGKAAGFALREP